MLQEESMQLLRNLLREEEGQDIIEYGVLAFFISIVAIVTIKLIGPLLTPIYLSISAALVP
jgi:Flp pilus assembly pilin Flp